MGTETPPVPLRSTPIKKLTGIDPNDWLAARISRTDRDGGTAFGAVAMGFVTTPGPLPQDPENLSKPPESIPMIGTTHDSCPILLMLLWLASRISHTDRDGGTTPQCGGHG